MFMYVCVYVDGVLFGSMKVDIGGCEYYGGENCSHFVCFHCRHGERAHFDIGK